MSVNLLHTYENHFIKNIKETFKIKESVNFIYHIERHIYEIVLGEKCIRYSSISASIKLP